MWEPHGAPQQCRERPGRDGRSRVVGDVPEVRPVGLQPRPRRDEYVEIVELRRQLPPHAGIADGGDARRVDQRSLESSGVLRAQSRRGGGLRHGDRRRSDVGRQRDRDRRPTRAGPGRDSRRGCDAAGRKNRRRERDQDAPPNGGNASAGSGWTRPADAPAAVRRGTAAAPCTCRLRRPGRTGGRRRGTVHASLAWWSRSARSSCRIAS